MFILTKISDLVRIPPDQFHRDTASAINHQLNNKYANKIIPHVGLCITIYDLLTVDEGQLKPGDGASFINVTFRALVFKPFVGEIITGWITQCTNEGIKVSLLGMFDDIFIPAKMLFEGSYYSVDDSAWVWQMDEETKLYFDVNEKIRFRVEQEVFVDVKPKSPREQELEEQLKEKDTLTEEEKRLVEKPPAYALLGSCQTDGMGLVSWWE
ncbi:ACR049Wp [Eremothecium gossypii ATCC 10895]|uniref:DNA-directed RNA polymerase subunit n=1 Tax=Eremothecium gossypii (strain ATCC 10895 / CBS 109.51 / FGSC 9923 / NRRL Y-1056) TaxID=284811 RepID=Q75C67_EREGS|nr:ACR049Wp [Eremothecium gossypii ATCC 10895]AAS51276.1 ACR049Wp [Eremothecium gossypii ATCC 10895]AEY95567.1 FACR049Wp [Eremothecium gossypii FDAG1]